tara:strand:+ start:15172 stop:16080 length:909 start_codon:yes stop_codon:yes gene_type:complete
MNTLHIDISVDNNSEHLDLKQDKKDHIPLVSSPHIQPIFEQFIKGTVLKGEINESIMKKYGDTFISLESKDNSFSPQIDQSNSKRDVKQKLDQKQNSPLEKGNTDQVEEKSTLTKPGSKIDSTARPDFKGKQSNTTSQFSGVHFKSSLGQAAKSGNLFQSNIESIQKVSKVQLISRITQIINNNISNNAAKSATYKLNGGEFGELEIKLTQRSSVTNAVMVVESDSIKSIIEKIVTEVKENLNEKGMKFESFKVEVGAEKQNNNKEKTFSQNIFYDIESENESLAEVETIRQFGYNTIEVIA